MSFLEVGALSAGAGLTVEMMGSTLSDRQGDVYGELRFFQRILPEDISYFFFDRISSLLGYANRGC